MKSPISSYRHVSYNRYELDQYHRRENRLMKKYKCGYSALHKKGIDLLDELTLKRDLATI